MKAWFAAVIMAATMVIVPASDAAAQNADYQTAERIFNSLPSKERFELPILLIATGHYNGMSTGEFGRRIFRGVLKFQAAIGSPQTGYLTSDQLARLRIAGYGAMSAWGMAEVVHPLTSAKIFVPKRAAPLQDYTRRGFSFDAYDKSVSVDFSFFSASESSLELLYAKLGAAGGPRKVDYKVIRPAFFAIAGSVADRGFYTRYQLARGGIVGFTTSWDLARIERGDRIANLMSNLFFVDLTGGVPDTSQVALPPPPVYVPPPMAAPPAAAPAPAPPSVVAAPKPETPRGGSGSGFFIAPKRLLTNAHVVEGCSTVTVAVGQAKAAGRVIAKDKTNDLALVDTDAKSETMAKLRSGVRLGEDVAAFGYPLNGFLATNGNFTRGGITATAGLRDDSSQLQISAPVQPGNSGGPLLDESGNVVGVVVSKLKVLQVAAITGDFPQNVNFAIKASVAQTFLETNRVRRRYGERSDEARGFGGAGPRLFGDH